MTEWITHAIQQHTDFSRILNASIAAGWMVPAVIVLRLLLKKAPKWTHVALWGLVALRLLLPFSVESAFSLIPSAQTVPQEILRYEGTQLQEEASLEVIANPVYSGAVSVPLGQTVDRVQIRMMDMTFVWLVGIAAMSLYTAVSYWQLRRRVKTAVRFTDNLFRCDQVSSPFVLGILRPRIYLPFRMAQSGLEYVIAHERAHIRRKDHWWKPLGFLLLTLHWFNPLMWLAYLLLCRDIELACDEKVIRELGNEQRADYTQALVSCSVSRRTIAACPLAFGEVGVKTRVKSVLNYKKPGFWVIVLAVILCIAAAVCFLTDPPANSEAVPFAHTYRVEEILYDAPMHSFAYTEETAPLYQFTSDQVMFVAEAATEWVRQQGAFEEAELTAENFDDLFHPVGWTASRYSRLRHRIEKAWQMNLENDRNNVFYYLLQDKSGEVYLTYGYRDPEKPSIRWLFKLTRTDLLTCTALSDGAETFVQPCYYPGKIEGDTEHWPVAHINKSGTLRFHAEADTDALVIREDYFQKDGEETHNTFEIKPDAEGFFTMEVTCKGSPDEYALYRIQFKDQSDGYAMKVVFGTDLQGQKEPDCVSVTYIEDPTKSPEFFYDEAMEKFYEDQANEYYLPGIYSAYVTVHYSDGSEENIVTALNSGKVTLADLDRYGIQYYSESKAARLYIAITGAIRNQHIPDTPDGLLHCASFVTLYQEELCLDSDPSIPSQVTVYGLAMHQAYSLSEGTLREVGGSHIPAVITFDLVDGAYVLDQYWMPRDGSYYAQDVRDSFPDHVEADALDTQKYVLRQLQECCDQAVRYGNINTDAVIEKLLETIEASPAASSRPGDYIRAHPMQWRELTHYGDHALRYLFQKFLKGGQTGLRGHLLRELLDELAPEAQLRLYAETGQAYFEEWKAGALRVRDQHGMDWVKENRPAMYLLLQILEGDAIPE